VRKAGTNNLRKPGAHVKNQCARFAQLLYFK